MVGMHTIFKNKLCMHHKLLLVKITYSKYYNVSNHINKLFGIK